MAGGLLIQIGHLGGSSRGKGWGSVGCVEFERPWDTGELSGSLKRSLDRDTDW